MMKIVAAVAAAAVGIAAPAGAAPADAAPSTAASVVDLSDGHCPQATALALARTLAHRWKSPVTDDGSASDGGAYLTGPNTAWLALSCAGGTFAGRPGFFVEAWDNWFVGPDRHQVRRRVVVDAAGSDLVPGNDTPAYTLSRYDDHSYTFATADLDGDGNDEVLVTDNFAHNSLAAGVSVTVLAVARTGITELKQPVRITSSGVSWPTCDGALTYERAGKAIHLVLAAAATNTNPDCPSPGRHVYALTRGAVVEVK
jgi:hypothetical protein